MEKIQYDYDKWNLCHQVISEARKLTGKPVVRKKNPFANPVR